jgi:hypothetical protein
MNAASFLFHIDPPSVADAGDEAAIQTRFRSRMRMRAPEVKLVAVPNAGVRTSYEKFQRAREGLVIGFPDLVCLWLGGCAFIEFKQRTGSLSAAQHDNLNWLARAGFACGVFRSVESAMAFLRAQGAPFMAEAA